MSKRSRKRTREDILSKRLVDDERRQRTKPSRPVHLYNPGTMLLNPFRPLQRTPSGIILLRR